MMRCNLVSLTVVPLELLPVLILEYFKVLFFSGKGSSEGSKLMAAIQPRAARGGGRLAPLMAGRMSGTRWDPPHLPRHQGRLASVQKRDRRAGQNSVVRYENHAKLPAVVKEYPHQLRQHIALIEPLYEGIMWG